MKGRLAVENVVLTVHLILALLLTGVVLLQRSEGGGLGVGGGGGNVMSGRQAANALTRLTWIFGVALFVTSLALTVIAARQTSSGSIMDQLGVTQQEQSEPALPGLPAYTPPPTTGGDPLTPPSPDAPSPDAPQAVPAEPAPAPEAEPVPAPEAAEPAADPLTPPPAPAPAPDGEAAPATGGN